MNRIKKLLLVTGIALIAAQFFQPAKNLNDQGLATDISKTIPVPGNVQVILKNACYDCHSNNTVYPWYANIQPMGWLMANHIKEGKAELNFNEFGNYSTRRQVSKLDGIFNSIKDGIMPLSSYKLMHKTANLNKNEKTLIMDWAQFSKDSLSIKN